LAIGSGLLELFQRPWEATGLMKESIRLMKFIDGPMKQNVIVLGWLRPNEVLDRFDGNYISPGVADALGKAYKQSVEGGY
jgi:hypothetical protein